MKQTLILNLKALGAVLALTLFTFGTPANAVEMNSGATFDHVQTGFPLLGAHARVDCQTCHLQGVFKGTPQQCDVCHAQGSRIASTFKPVGHPPTTRPCQQCHSSQVSWLGARFDHIGVRQGSCESCHNSVAATGKPMNHVVTFSSCDVCHRTTAWIPAAFDHVGVVAGTCTSCHGTTATGKPRGHLVTNSECDTCHYSTSWTPLKYFDHADAVAGQCSTCHGVTSTGKRAGHVPTTLSCDACHYKAPQKFTPSTFSHAPTQGVVDGQCSTCHSGAYASSGAMGKPKTHIVTSAECNGCHHSTTSWIPADYAYDHSGAVPGQCTTCHGLTTTGMKPGHIPTTLSCDACHEKSPARFTSTTFSHQASQGVVDGQCSTCHNGSYTSSGAVGKPRGHISTTSECNACHSRTAWIPAATNFDHALATPGACADCHGKTSMGKKAGHIPTTLSCDACHNKAPQHFTPSTFTHLPSQGVSAGQCLTCHNGSYTSSGAQGKSMNHIPTIPSTLSCDACHSQSQPLFTPSTFSHQASQGVVDGQCSICHNGSYATAGAVGKPLGHQVTSSECNACHSRTAWRPASGAVDHATLPAGGCADCHGVTSTGKKNGHIPTTLSCDACHNRSPQKFAPSTFAHTAAQGVTPGKCVTCHDGTYLSSNAYGMNTQGYKHFPPRAGYDNCDLCHKSYTAFTSYTFSHTTAGVVMSATTVCSTCHDGTHIFNGHLMGYQGPHRSLPNGGKCADGCHNSFTSWSSGVGSAPIAPIGPASKGQKPPRLPKFIIRK